MRMNPETFSPFNPLTRRPLGDVDVTMAFDQNPRLGNLNKKVSVFRYQKQDLIPLRLSKPEDLPFMLDLLLGDGQAYHNVLTKDLKILVTNLKQQIPRSCSKICRSCLNACYTAEMYGKHLATCMQNEAATFKPPDVAKNNLRVQNYQTRWFAPLVMFFDSAKCRSSNL